jgi:hypothetical protein
MRWVDRYKDKGDVKRVNRSPISYKVKNEHVKFILDILKKNKTITMDTCKNILSGSYERNDLYVKKSRKKSNRKYKTYKD